MIMFKVPKENSQGEAGIQVVAMLNDKYTKMTEVDIFFWIFVLEDWFDAKTNEICKFTREYLKQEEFENMKQEMGIKENKGNKKNGIKEQGEKEALRAKKDGIKSEMDFMNRVHKKADEFIFSHECVKWAMKVGRNRFSVAVVERYLTVEVEMASEYKADSILILNYFLGRLKLSELISALAGRTCYIVGVSSVYRYMFPA